MYSRRVLPYINHLRSILRPRSFAESFRLRCNPQVRIDISQLWKRSVGRASCFRTAMHHSPLASAGLALARSGHSFPIISACRRRPWRRASRDYWHRLAGIWYLRSPHSFTAPMRPVPPTASRQDARTSVALGSSAGELHPICFIAASICPCRMAMDRFAPSMPPTMTPHAVARPTNTNLAPSA